MNINHTSDQSPFCPMMALAATSTLLTTVAHVADTKAESASWTMKFAVLRNLARQPHYSS